MWVWHLESKTWSLKLGVWNVGVFWSSMGPGMWCKRWYFQSLNWGFPLLASPTHTGDPLNASLLEHREVLLKHPEACCWNDRGLVDFFYLHRHNVEGLLFVVNLGLITQGNGHSCRNAETENIFCVFFRERSFFKGFCPEYLLAIETSIISAFLIRNLLAIWRRRE